MTDQKKQLAKNPPTDGYGEVSQEQRPGDFLRFLDGAWSKADLPVEPSFRPVAYAVDHAVTHWCDQKVVEEITAKPLAGPRRAQFGNSERTMGARPEMAI